MHAQALAHAHVERVILEQFQKATQACESESVTSTLAQLCALFALHSLEQDRAWFLEQGYMSAAKTKAIRKQVNRLCLEVRANAVGLVDAFNIPDVLLAAPIAFE